MYCRVFSPSTKITKQDALTLPSLDDEEEEEDAFDVFLVNCVGATKLDPGEKLFKSYQILTVVSGFLKEFADIRQ